MYILYLFANPVKSLTIPRRFPRIAFPDTSQKNITCHASSSPVTGLNFSRYTVDNFPGHWRKVNAYCETGARMASDSGWTGGGGRGETRRVRGINGDGL